MNGLLGKFEFPAKSALPINSTRVGKIFREISAAKFFGRGLGWGLRLDAGPFANPDHELERNEDLLRMDC